MYKKFLALLVVISVFFLIGSNCESASNEVDKFKNMTQAEQIEYIDKEYHDKLLQLIALFKDSYLNVVKVANTEGEFLVNTELLSKEIFRPKLWDISLEYNNKIADKVYPLYISYDNLYDNCLEYVCSPIKNSDICYGGLPWYKKILCFWGLNKSLFPNVLTHNFIECYDMKEECIEVEKAELIYQDTLSKLKFGHGIYMLNLKNYNLIMNGMTEYEVIRIFNMPPGDDLEMREIDFDEHSYWRYWFKIDIEKLYGTEYIPTDYIVKPSDKNKFIRVKFIWNEKRNEYVVCDKEYNL